MGDPDDSALEVDLSPDLADALSRTSYQDCIRQLDLVLGCLSSESQKKPTHEMDESRQLFQQDVGKLRERMKRSRKGFLDPRALYVQRWDLCTATALLYTCFVTPFEVGIMTKSSVGPLFYVNQFINAIFVFDMGVQFFMPVPDPVTGEMIRNHARLAKGYLRGWFAIDLVSVLPVDIIVALGPDIMPTDNSAIVRVVRLLRIARLFKLMRVLRASRIIQRWENAIAVSTSTRSIVTAWFSFVVILHWFACVWALLPQFVSSWRELGAAFETPLVDRMVARIELLPPGDTSCTGCFANGTAIGGMQGVWQCSTQCLTDCEQDEIARIVVKPLSYVYNQESWLCRAVNDGYLNTDFDDDYFRVWMMAILVAFFQLVGGIGTVSPSNLPEITLFLVSLFGGTIIFAMLQGIIVQVLTTGDPDETEFKQQLDALNFMMEDNKFEKATRLRVRHFFRMSKTLIKRRSYVKLIDETMSDELRGDVRYLVSQTLFDNVWYFAGCERSFLEDVSMFVTRDSYATGEHIETGDSLNVLVQGVISRGGAILLQGAHWGDAIVGSSALRDTRDAKALAYCEIARVSREAIEKVCKDYPITARHLRIAGLKLATRRGIHLCALVARIVSLKQANDAKEQEEAAASSEAGTKPKRWAALASNTTTAGRWGVLQAHVKHEFNPMLKQLRHSMKKRNRLAFVTDVGPVKYKPTSILQAIHKSTALQDKGNEATAPRWREIDESREAPEEAQKRDKSPNARPRRSKAGSGTAGDSVADLNKRVDTLTKLVETMEANRRADEANRRADSKEVLERLTRLEMPAHGKYVIVSRRNGHDPDFHEEASTSFTSTDHPPSRSRQSRRALRLARARTNTNLESMDVAHATPPGPDLGA